MGLSRSDEIRFTTIEKIIADAISNIPDGWDWMGYFDKLKEEHEDVEALQKQVKELKETNEYLDSTLDEIRSMF